MYAIFQSGGKQYQVKKGQIVRLEKLDIEMGQTFMFNKIMMIVNESDIKIGDPFIKGSQVIVKIVAHGRDDKLMIIKFHRRKHFRRNQGHRQWFTDVKVIDIVTL